MIKSRLMICRRVMNNNGVITIKVLLMLTTILTVFSLLFHQLYLQFDRNTELRNYSVKLDNILVDYDTYLYVNYGLYGYTEISDGGAFKHRLSTESEQYNLQASSPLSEPDVIKNQIVSFMKYRMPVNYLDQVLSKIDLIKKSDKTKGAIELKTIVETALSTLQTYFDQRIELASAVNSLDYQKLNLFQLDSATINDDWRIFLSKRHQLLMDQVATLEKLKEAKIDYEKYNNMFQLIEKPSEYQLQELEVKHQLVVDLNDVSEMNQQELIFLNETGQGILKRIESIRMELDNYKTKNRKLLKNVHNIVDKAEEIVTLIGDVKNELLESDAIDEVIDSINTSLDQYIVSLVSDVLQNNSENQNVIETEINTNIRLLESCLHKLTLPSFEVALTNENIISGLYLEELDQYNHNFETYPDRQNHQTSKADETYYETYKTESENQYHQEVEGVEIPDDYGINQHEQAGFWRVHQLVQTLENMVESLMVNEYIMSTFMAYSKGSISDFDYFDKYERTHYFAQGEIEYILMGKRNEVENVVKTMAVIYGIRTVMNGIHVYTDKEKMVLSESIGLSVAGWTGFGAPLISNIIRVGWSVGESFIDMEHLLKGEGVPFLKIYPSQWYLDIGFLKNKYVEKNTLALIDFTYHDYIRLMLITVSEKVKLTRINDLISLNLRKENRTWPLQHYYTVIDVLDNEDKVILRRSYE